MQADGPPASYARYFDRQAETVARCFDALRRYAEESAPSATVISMIAQLDQLEAMFPDGGRILARARQNPAGGIP